MWGRRRRCIEDLDSSAYWWRVLEGGGIRYGPECCLLPGLWGSANVAGLGIRVCFEKVHMEWRERSSQDSAEFH